MATLGYSAGEGREMIDEFSITQDQLPEIKARVDDLKIQAMMFDMDIDWEAASLMPKRKDETPFWVKRWQEKQAGSDYTVYDNGN